MATNIKLAIFSLLLLSLLSLALLYGPLSGDVAATPVFPQNEQQATSDDDEPGDEAADKDADSEKQIADELAVPEGDIAALLEFISKPRNLRPHMETKEKLSEYRNRLADALFEAADKILALDATDEQALQAVQTKLRAIQIWRSLGDKKGDEQYQKLIASADDEPRPAVARVLKRQSLLDRAGKWSKDNSDAERQAVLADVETVFSGDKFDRQQFGLAVQVGRMLQQSGDTDLAIETYTKIGSKFAKSDNSNVAVLGEKLLGVARQLNLVGNEIELDGKLMDGADFDWSAYKGKVVLVDFWATWCYPCVMELPNVLKQYELYHDKGFEVVGISLDTSREKLEQFVEARKIPWATLFSDDKSAQGWNHPLATKYGVMGIPLAILVDQNGKVITLKARGAELGRQLEKLLGKAEEKEAVKTTEM